MKSKEKVYVARFGCYSDQGISGVFSTREKADKYCAIQNELGDGCYGDYWVDEYTLDEREFEQDVKVVTYYYAQIGIKDEKSWDGVGYVNRKGVLDPDGSYEDKDIYSKDVDVFFKDSYIEVRSIFSQEHAEKVAIEQYQIYTQQELEGN